MYLHVRADNGSACAVIPVSTHAQNGTENVPWKKRLYGSSVSATLRKSATLPKPDTHNTCVYEPLQPCAVRYNKRLAICVVGSNGKLHTMGYILWRKKDNHKMVFLRDEHGTFVEGPKVPQRKHTSQSLLHTLVDTDADIVLRDKSGRDGGTFYGAPKFNSSSIASGWNVL